MYGMNDMDSEYFGVPLDDGLPTPKPPMCHMTPMSYECADDGCMQVEFWECTHCGHTKEIGSVLAG